MSDLSIHPIEYLKIHVHTDFGLIEKRFLVTFARKVFDLAKQVATVTVVFLTIGLVIFAFMQIGEAASVTAGFKNVITEMVVPLY